MKLQELNMALGTPATLYEAIAHGLQSVNVNLSDEEMIRLQAHIRDYLSQSVATEMIQAEIRGILETEIQEIHHSLERLVNHWKRSSK